MRRVPTKQTIALVIAALLIRLASNCGEVVGVFAGPEEIDDVADGVPEPIGFSGLAQQRLELGLSSGTSTCYYVQRRRGD